MGKLAVVVPGDQYGRLTIIKEVERHRQPNGVIRRQMLCRCECGNESTVTLPNLRSGHTTSCGRGQHASGRKNATHGRCGTQIYRAWQDMIQRCYNTGRKRYPLYGGRGITVCRRWRDSFEAFFEDMEEPPSTGHSIDRVDNNKGYSKENCRWATRKEQAQNTSRSIMLTHHGETLCIAEWAERLGVAYHTLYYRIKSGWSAEVALAKPVKGKP